jgi:hypothetical protein
MDITYREYSIEAIETSSGQWRAYISRMDGYNIKTYTGQITDQILAPGGMEEFSAQAAIIVAKKLIDNGQMTRAEPKDQEDGHGE